MVTSYNHQRTKNNFLEACILNLLDNLFTSGIFRLTLYRTDESIGESKLFHLGLHLIIGYICSMGSTMTHKYKCSSILSCCFHAVITGCFYSFIGDRLGNCLLVVIDNGSVVAYLAQHRLCDGYGLKFIFITVDRFYHLIVLSAVHQMSRLYNQVLNAIVNGTLKSLIHIVDLLVISCLYMVDDDLSGKCSSYRPIRICFLQSILDALDILCTAVVEGSTKAYNQKLVLTDLIAVAGIVFGSVAGVTSEILRACLFTFNQLFLSVGQLIPCFFGCGTVCIGSIGSLLNIDLIDQSCYIISCCLIVALRACLSGILRCCFGCCLCYSLGCCLGYSLACCLCYSLSGCLGLSLGSIYACGTHHCDGGYTHHDCQSFYHFVFHVTSPP